MPRGYVLGLIPGATDASLYARGHMPNPITGSVDPGAVLTDLECGHGSRQKPLKNTPNLLP